MSGFYPQTNEPATVEDENPRCVKCNKLLAVKLTRPWSIRCPRCKTLNSGDRRLANDQSS